MNKENLHNPSITEDKFFDTSNIKNKKIIKLTSIMKELQNKIEDIGLDISFIQKENKPFKKRRL